MTGEAPAREKPSPSVRDDGVVLGSGAQARKAAGGRATVMNIHEAASRLAATIGLRDVAPADVRELAERGAVRAVIPGRLYDLEGVRSEAVEGELRRIGEARRAWLTASLDRWDAATALGVSVEEFEARAARGGLRQGRFGRYPRRGVMGLQADGPGPHPERWS